MVTIEGRHTGSLIDPVDSGPRIGDGAAGPAMIFAHPASIFIHAAVFHAGREPLVTQIYIEGEPRNSGDFLFNRVPEDRRSRVVAAFEPAGNPDVELQARFDIVVGETPEQA